jgi:hypothetical protein
VCVCKYLRKDPFWTGYGEIMVCIRNLDCNALILWEIRVRVSFEHMYILLKPIVNVYTLWINLSLHKTDFSM